MAEKRCESVSMVATRAALGAVQQNAASRVQKIAEISFVFIALWLKPHFLTWINPLSMVAAALRVLGLPRAPQYAGVESMADGTRKNGDRDTPSSDEAALSARLKRLGERLGKQTGRPVDNSPGASSAADASAMARGFRLSTELVAGVLAGAALGWLLDRWLGISPWGLIVFLLLGFAAGVLNVMRAAGVNTGMGPKAPD
jgi:ATP synthase protein I